jgi:hypothetical protein
MMEQIKTDLGVATQNNETSSSQTVNSQTTAESEKVINRENIKVQVLNGSKKSGLASQLKKELEEKGYSSVKIGDTKDMTYGYTRVIDRSGDKEKLQVVSQDLNINIVESDIDNACGYDITVIIGKDRINGGM